MENQEVVILCGGKGTRLSEETQKKPKPMVEIGGKPILWHIMKIYAQFGFKKFILALGYRGDYIKKFFYDYRITASDFTMIMHPDHSPEVLNELSDSDWEITFVDTGLETLKGGRIKRLEKYVKAENFHLTYGDGVANVNISELLAFHKRHGQIGTLTAVRPPSRFGELNLIDNRVENFEEKPQLATGYINGGFFVFKHEIFDYLTPDVSCDFEFGPLQEIARDGQLYAYKHDDFWQCMDNIRERDYLEKLWNTGKAEWKVW